MERLASDERINALIQTGLAECTLVHLDGSVVVHEGPSRLAGYSELGPDVAHGVGHPHNRHVVGIGLFSCCDRRQFGTTARSPLGPEPDDNVLALE